MPRAYTKSGSIEKYEGGMTVTISTSSVTKPTITPDTNGNYSWPSISNYTYNSNATSGDFYLTTNYQGKTCIAYYKKNITTVYVRIGSISTTSVTITWTTSNLSSSLTVTIHCYGGIQAGTEKKIYNVNGFGMYTTSISGLHKGDTWAVSEVHPTTMGNYTFVARSGDHMTVQ